MFLDRYRFHLCSSQSIERLQHIWPGNKVATGRFREAFDVELAGFVIEHFVHAENFALGDDADGENSLLALEPVWSEGFVGEGRGDLELTLNYHVDSVWFRPLFVRAIVAFKVAFFDVLLKDVEARYRHLGKEFFEFFRGFLLFLPFDFVQNLLVICLMERCAPNFLIGSDGCCAVALVAFLDAVFAEAPFRAEYFIDFLQNFD